jgi:excisionase family DNA binding protein
VETRPDNQGPFDLVLAPYLTRAQVAEVLAISERFVDRLIRRGELAAAKVGACVRIDPRSVRSYIDRNAILTRL